MNLFVLDMFTFSYMSSDELLAHHQRSYQMTYFIENIKRLLREIIYKCLIEKLILSSVLPNAKMPMKKGSKDCQRPLDRAFLK